eukprot:6477994-Amphidinium_carterae.1
MVRDLLGNSKTVTAWVLVAGAKAISITHPAREVALAQGVAAELSIIAHAREMEAANFAAFQQRSNLHQFIGKHGGFVYIKAAFTRDTMHGKMHTYLVEMARDQVRSLLQVSGANGVTIGANEVLDAELGFTTVYTDAHSLSSLLQRLDEVKHEGVVGPLRRGGYLIRCMIEEVAMVRKAVNPNDPRFTQFPSLVVVKRFRARVSQDITPIQLAASLAQSLNWKCVGLSTQRSGGQKSRFHVVILGSDTAPPEWQVILRGQIVRLEGLQAQVGGEVGVGTFQPPAPTARVHTVTDDMKQQMLQQRSTLENVIQTQLGQAQHRVQDEARQAITDLRNEVVQQVEGAELRAQGAVVDLSAKLAEMEKGQKAQETQTQQALADLQAKLHEVQSGQKAQGLQHAALGKKVDDQAEITQQLATEVKKHGDDLQALGPRLQAQFAEFGKDILQQVAQIAKKRDAPVPEGDRDSQKPRRHDAQGAAPMVTGEVDRMPGGACCGVGAVHRRAGWVEPAETKSGWFRRHSPMGGVGESPREL